MNKPLKSVTHGHATPDFGYLPSRRKQRHTGVNDLPGLLPDIAACIRTHDRRSRTSNALTTRLPSDPTKMVVNLVMSE